MPDNPFKSLHEELPFAHRVYAVLACDLLLVLYVKLVILSLRPGKPRLWGAVPPIVVTCVLPLLFHRDTEVVTLVAVAFLHVWLTNFKVLGLALERGPLTLPLSHLQFATVLLAPITPQIGARPLLTCNLSTFDYNLQNSAMRRRSTLHLAMQRPHIPAQRWQHVQALREQGAGTTVLSCDAADGEMHRVGSKGRLADSGGSSAELLTRFAAKTAGLCGVVFCLAAFDPPLVFQEILYGEDFSGYTPVLCIMSTQSRGYNVAVEICAGNWDHGVGNRMQRHTEV